MCCAWLWVISVIHWYARVHFSHYRLPNLSKSINRIWGTVWVAVVGEIWKYRNKILFRNVIADPIENFTMT